MDRYGGCGKSRRRGSQRQRSAEPSIKGWSQPSHAGCTDAPAPNPFAASASRSWLPGCRTPSSASSPRPNSMAWATSIRTRCGAPSQTAGATPSPIGRRSALFDGELKKPARSASKPTTSPASRSESRTRREPLSTCCGWPVPWARTVLWTACGTSRPRPGTIRLRPIRTTPSPKWRRYRRPSASPDVYRCIYAFTATPWGIANPARVNTAGPNSSQTDSLPRTRSLAPREPGAAH